MNRASWLGGLALLAIPVVTIPVQATFARSAAPALHATRCNTRELQASLGQQTGGAGSVFTAIVLRNVGSRTCTLGGYAGVSLVDRRHRQIGRAARWVSGPIRRITLHPGGAASMLVRTLNPGVGTTNCLPPSAALRIYPPDNRNALLVPARLSECLGSLDVRPLVAGTSGE